jgi:hypothetical protein
MVYWTMFSIRRTLWSVKYRRSAYGPGQCFHWVTTRHSLEHPRTFKRSSLSLSSSQTDAIARVSPPSRDTKRGRVWICPEVELFVQTGKRKAEYIPVIQCSLSPPLVSSRSFSLYQRRTAIPSWLALARSVQPLHCP